MSGAKTWWMVYGGTTRPARLFALFFILAMAVFVRMIAAREAYPAPGDGGHFVQYGVEWANGDPSGMSTYWSQGMIAIAAAAYRMGWSPHQTLQFASMISGTLLAVLAAWLAFVLFKRWDRGLVAALLVTASQRQCGD